MDTVVVLDSDTEEELVVAESEPEEEPGEEPEEEEGDEVESAELVGEFAAACESAEEEAGASEDVGDEDVTNVEVGESVAAEALSGEELSGVEEEGCKEETSLEVVNDKEDEGEEVAETAAEVEAMEEFELSCRMAKSTRTSVVCAVAGGAADAVSAGTSTADFGISGACRRTNSLSFDKGP